MNKKIMIVDDDPDILTSVRALFEKEGYGVICADGGKECLKILDDDNEKPDIILLDIMMPDISGWDVFIKIRQKSSCKEIPIIFLTAKTDKYSQGFGKFSAEDYITKPFEIEELLTKINKILKDNYD